MPPLFFPLNGHAHTRSTGQPGQYIIPKGNYTRNLKSPVFFFDGQPISVSQKNAFSATAQLNQVIFNSAVFTGVGTARTYQEAARETYRNALAETMYNVRQMYYTALFARETWELLQRSLENAEENLRNVRVMMNEGLVAEYDAIRAEVATENIRPQVLEAEQQYKDATNALKLVIGLDVNREVTPTGEFTYQTESLPGLAELQDKAVIANYSLRALELQMRVNQELIDINRSEYLPTVSLFGNYTYQGQADDFNFITVSSASAGLNLSLSIFKGFQSDARVQQARIDYLRIQEQYRSALQALRLQIETVAGRVENARRRIEAQGRTVDQAQRGYEIAQIRYNAGTGTQLEINDAELALRQARLNRVQAIFDYLVSRSQLGQFLGDVPERYLQTVPGM